MSKQPPLESTLNKQDTLLAGCFVKRDNIDFTYAGSCYKIDFNKQESALSGVSLGTRLSHLSRVDCTQLKIDHKSDEQAAVEIPGVKWCFC